MSVAGPHAPVIVSEVFGPTVQGEGPATGRRAHFVRLGGCNLTCTWCDAPYTWNGKRYDLRTELDRTTAVRVMNDLTDAELPELVVITGGEPLLQQRAGYGLIHLARLLAASGVEVHVETNGTLVPDPELGRVVALFVVSPKLEHAGMALARTIKREALEAFASFAELGRAVLKFVCRTPDDVHLAAGIADAHGFARSAVWVMPEGTTPEAIVAGHARLMQATLAHRVNMSTRLHILAYGDRRGT